MIVAEDVHNLRFAFVFFQAEDGIRDLVRSRGLGDVYKRQDKGLRGWCGYRHESVAYLLLESHAGMAVKTDCGLSLIHI